MKNFLYVVGKHRRSFILILVAGLATNALVTAMNPLFLKFVFDEGVIKKDFRLFIIASTGFIAVATIWRLLNMAFGLSLQRLKNAILKDLATGHLAKYYRLPYDEIMRHEAGYFASRIYDEPLAASGAVPDLAIELANAAVSFAVAFAIVVSLSAKATAMLVLAVPLLMYLGRRFGSDIRRHSYDEKEREGSLRGMISSAAQAHRTVNLFRLELGVFARLAESFDSYIRSSYGRVKSSIIHNTLGSIFISYGEMLVTVVCGYEILCGRMTFGGFMAFMNAFWIAVGSLRSLMQKAPEVSKVNALVQRLREFEAREDALPPDISPDGGVHLHNASFAYGQSPVFADLTFSVGKGEKVMLSGRNGSGKSTVANVIAGFLRPCKGIAQTRPREEVSACISPHHFVPGTVRDNLDGGLSSGERKAYLKALTDDLDLTACMDKRPDELSAGQKKKVEVVMGLLKEADLYLFDEPLANVDADSKGKLMRHILDRARGKTLVVVMHGDSELQRGFDRTIHMPPAAG